MDASSIVGIDEQVGLLGPDDGAFCLRGAGAIGAASCNCQFDTERLLDLFDDRAAGRSTDRVRGLRTDGLRDGQHSLTAGVNRLVGSAHAICAVDTRHGIAMIG